MRAGGRSGSRCPFAPSRTTRPPAARTVSLTSRLGARDPRASPRRPAIRRANRSASDRSDAASASAPRNSSSERPCRPHFASQCSATTASFSSPRTSCSRSAALANALAGLPTIGSAASAAYRTRFVLMRTAWSSSSDGLSPSLPARFSSLCQGRRTSSGTTSLAGSLALSRREGAFAAATRSSSSLR